MKPEEPWVGTAPSRLLTAAEAGQVLGTGERFVRRLVSERRIAFYKVGAKLRLSEHDLHAFLADGRVDAADGRG